MGLSHPEAYLSRLRQSVDFLVREVGDPVPAAVVLGSGLGGLLDDAAHGEGYPFRDIPNFPVVAVDGHEGSLVVAELDSRRFCVLQGRVHLYEGWDAPRVVFAVRALSLWGVRIFVLTNAAGGVNPAYSPGDLMLIRDHLNLSGSNPLTGINLDVLGERFPDLTDAYSPELLKECRQAALDLDLRLHEGVYAALPGPSYETPAEIRMLATLGADAVGMSTVQEVIALRHMGRKVLGISFITNQAAGLQAGPLSHLDVLAAAALASGALTRLLKDVLRRICPPN